MGTTESKIQLAMNLYNTYNNYQDDSDSCYDTNHLPPRFGGEIANSKNNLKPVPLTFQNSPEETRDNPTPFRFMRSDRDVNSYGGLNRDHRNDFSSNKDNNNDYSSDPSGKPTFFDRADSSPLDKPTFLDPVAKDDNSDLLNPNSDVSLEYTVHIPPSQCGDFAREHAERVASGENQNEIREVNENLNSMLNDDSSSLLDMGSDTIVGSIVDKVVGDIPVQTDELGKQMAEEKGFTFSGKK